MKSGSALKLKIAGLAGLLWSCIVVAQLFAAMPQEPMLPQTYLIKSDQSVAGWLMSEKLDGVRGYWDGEHLFSKNGTPFFPHSEFIRDLPPFPLEGELWGGRGSFAETVSIVRRQHPHAGWLQLKFAIFDVPEDPGGFTTRIARAEEWFANHPSAYGFVIRQVPVRDRNHLRKELRRIEKLGGEGLIVRRPDAMYHAGRSADILKVKSHQDAEATVVAHLPGHGRNRGRLGALLVEFEDGTRFKIGSGFRDAEREDPPPVGSVITLKYYGTYASGIPKFPSFVRQRLDLGL